MGHAHSMCVIKNLFNYKQVSYTGVYTHTLPLINRIPLTKQLFKSMVSQLFQNGSVLIQVQLVPLFIYERHVYSTYKFVRVVVEIF